MRRSNQTQDVAASRTIERSVVVEPGVSIAYVLERPRGELRNSPRIVLVSGASPYDREYLVPMGDVLVPAYRNLARVLVARGYSVIRFDERGTGKSTGSYAQTATTTQLAADLRAVIRDARSIDKNAPRPLVIVGHSEGAVIAAIAAHDLDTRDGVALLGAPSLPGDSIMRRQTRHQLTDDTQWAPHTSTEERIRAMQREHERRLRDDPWYREFLKLDPLPHYARVAGPMLLLHGANDWQVGVDQAEAIAAQQRRIVGRDITLHIIDGVDHCFQRHPTDMPIATPEVWDALTTWLATRWPREGLGIRAR